MISEPVMIDRKNLMMRRATRLCATLVIAFAGGIITLTVFGCGGRIDQTLQLAAFELPNDRPKSGLYRRLMEAYYRTDPAKAPSMDLARAHAFDPSDLTDERAVWVREMYEIQSIDRGERIFASYTIVETWAALTPRARLAILPWLD